MIKKEMLIFIIVGILTVAIDFMSYKTLVGFEFANVNTSKGLGFVIGTLFAYFANKMWTFKHNIYESGSIVRFSLLYATSLFLNIIINSALLSLLANYKLGIQISFLFATTVSAILNFIGMKYFVFNNKNQMEQL